MMGMIGAPGGAGTGTMGGGTMGGVGVDVSGGIPSGIGWGSAGSGGWVATMAGFYDGFYDGGTYDTGAGMEARGTEWYYDARSDPSQALFMIVANDTLAPGPLSKGKCIITNS